MINLIELPINLLLKLQEKIGQIYYIKSSYDKLIIVQDKSESIMDQVSFTSDKHKGNDIIIFKNRNISMSDPVKFIRSHIDELD